MFPFLPLCFLFFLCFLQLLHDLETQQAAEMASLRAAMSNFGRLRGPASNPAEHRLELLKSDYCQEKGEELWRTGFKAHITTLAQDVKADHEKAYAVELKKRQKAPFAFLKEVVRSCPQPGTAFTHEDPVYLETFANMTRVFAQKVVAQCLDDFRIEVHLPVDDVDEDGAPTARNTPALAVDTADDDHQSDQDLPLRTWRLMTSTPLSPAVGQ